MKYLRNTLIVVIAVALVAFATGCDGQGSSDNSSPSAGHHH